MPRTSPITSQAFERRPENGAGLRCPPVESVAQHDLELLVGDRRRQGISGIGAGPGEPRLAPRPLRDLTGGNRTADREAGAHALGEGDHIRHHVVMFEAPELPRSRRRELRFVQHQQRTLCLGQRLEPRQPFRRRYHHAARDQHGLGQHRRDVAARHVVDELARTFEAGHVASRIFQADRAAVAEGRVHGGRVGRCQQRPEIATPGTADGGHRFDREAATVEAADHREDVVLACDGERHAHGDLVRLRAGDREVHDLEPIRQGAGDTLGEAHDMRVRVPRVLVPETLRLRAHGLDQLGVAMAEHVAHHSGGEVVIGFSVHVEEPDSLPPFELDRGRVAPAEDAPGVAGHQVRVGAGGYEVSHGALRGPPARRS